MPALPVRRRFAFVAPRFRRDLLRVAFARCRIRTTQQAAGEGAPGLAKHQLGQMSGCEMLTQRRCRRILSHGEWRRSSMRGGEPRRHCDFPMPSWCSAFPGFAFRPLQRFFERPGAPVAHDAGTCRHLDARTLDTGRETRHRQEGQTTGRSANGGWGGAGRPGKFLGILFRRRDPDASTVGSQPRVGLGLEPKGGSPCVTPSSS